MGDNDHITVWESLGHFATQPRVCNNVLTISPRVRADEGTYYGMTAVDLSDSNFRQLDQLVLPAASVPSRLSTWAIPSLSLSRASYNGAGSLGNMGTFVGREGGPYIYVSREPAACPAARTAQYIVKTRASYYVVNTQEETYAVLSCPDRSLDYGEYPASEGTCDQFLTYATVKNEQGIPLVSRRACSRCSRTAHAVPVCASQRRPASARRLRGVRLQRLAPVRYRHQSVCVAPRASRAGEQLFFHQVTLNHRPSLNAQLQNSPQCS